MKEPGRVFTVSEITAEIKEMLENRFDLIWVTGEISNFSAPVSGHYYFTLKDDRAQIRAVMFRGQNRLLKFMPENGMDVTGMGRIGVYEPRGTYQVIFETLEPKGLGALQKAFEQLKEALEKEGLFDESTKKPLPFLPRRIAVVTSPSGAAVRDFLRISLQRFPHLEVDVVPVQVQGARAAEDISRALVRLNRWQRPEVIVLARGGGSLEDLEAFNSEVVARAVHESRIPVVSAVGHETDFTIADFVADRRAPTPSAAGEMVVPDRAELLRRCLDLRRRLILLMSRRAASLQEDLCGVRRRLTHPKRRLDELRLKVDDLTGRGIRAIRADRRRRCERLGWHRRRLLSTGPQKRISELKQKHDVLLNNILFLLIKKIDRQRSAVRDSTGRLHALNPHSVLLRGYSITRTAPGNRVVRDPAEVSKGQRLRITLARGDLSAVAEGGSQLRQPE